MVDIDWFECPLTEVIVDKYREDVPDDILEMFGADQVDDLSEEELPKVALTSFCDDLAEGNKDLRRDLVELFIAEITDEIGHKVFMIALPNVFEDYGFDYEEKRGSREWLLKEVS